MLENEDNPQLMSTLCDYKLMEVLSHLNINEMSELSRVSKQYNRCVDQLFREQKELIMNVMKKYNKSLFKRRQNEIDIRLVITSQNNTSNITDLKHNYEPILKKLTHLKSIRLRVFTINEEFCHWISSLFPNIKSIQIELRVLCLNHFSLITKYFGSKIQEIVFEEHEDELYQQLDNQIQFPFEFFALTSLKTISLRTTLFRTHHLNTILENIQQNVKELRIVVNLLQNPIILDTLRSGHTKHLICLWIESRDESGNELLETICKQLPKLEELTLYCNDLQTLRPLSYAKNLKVLKIAAKETSESSFDISIDSQISAKLEKLFIHYQFTYSRTDIKDLLTNDVYRNYKYRKGTKITNDSIKFIEKSFPNLKRLSIRTLKVFCDCNLGVRVCFICNKNFIKSCVQLIKNTLAHKKTLKIDLNFKSCKPNNYNIILFTAIFEEFIRSEHTFEMSINSWELKNKGGEELAQEMRLKFSELLFHLIKEISCRRPSNKFYLKMHSSLSFDGIENFLPLMLLNSKLEFVNEKYSSENEILKDHEFVIHLNRLEYNLLMVWKKKDSISKRLELSFNINPVLYNFRH